MERVFITDLYFPSFFEAFNDISCISSSFCLGFLDLFLFHSLQKQTSGMLDKKLLILR